MSWIYWITFPSQSENGHFRERRRNTDSLESGYLSHNRYICAICQHTETQSGFCEQTCRCAPRQETSAVWKLLYGFMGKSYSYISQEWSKLYSLLLWHNGSFTVLQRRYISSLEAMSLSLVKPFLTVLHAFKVLFGTTRGKKKNRLGEETLSPNGHEL